MLSSESSQEKTQGFIVVSERLKVLATEVNKDPWVHTGDTVEDGLGEVSLPLAFPGGDDILHFGIGINGPLRKCAPLFANFLLVHGEDVEGLIELDSFTETTVFGVIAINHNYS